MPEGDTIWLHARKLDRALGGRRLVSSDFRIPSLATTDLTGGVVREARSRGKHLLIRIQTPDRGDWTLRSHLRMDGTWRIFRPGQRWSGGPAHTIRVVLTTDESVAVGFHLYDIALVPSTEEASLVGHLGPDLLGPDWDPEEAVRRLSAQPEPEIAVAPLDQRNLAGASKGLYIAPSAGRSIGEALLDQRCLAGLGNLYKSETLFLSGVNPFMPVSEVRDLAKVVNLAHRLLFANRERWEQVTTGIARRGQEHWVYRRAREPCRRCGSPIKAASQGPTPYDRTTYWCPSCQPAC